MKFDLSSDKKVYETEYGIQVAGDSREVLRLLPDELRQRRSGRLCRMVI
jgi:hypothetical protein